MCGEVGLISGMTTLRVVGGKMGVMIYETTIMFLAPIVGGDSPNSWKLCNRLNTQVALFSSPIKLNFHGQTVLN